MNKSSSAQFLIFNFFNDNLNTMNVIGMEMFPMLRMGIREPDDFLPDRWMDGDIDALKLKELFIPFSTGKRGCVGQTLALLEMKLVIATLFYSYDFELISEVEELYFLTLKPQNANFKISRRVKESVY